MQVMVEGMGELTHGQTVSFTFNRKDGKKVGGFVIKSQQEYRAYYNRCNHWPVELDLGDGDFYYDKIDRITCKSHGATYQLDTGYCDGGPCSGTSLLSFEVSVEGDTATVETGDL